MCDGLYCRCWVINPTVAYTCWRGNELSPHSAQQCQQSSSGTITWELLEELLVMRTAQEAGVWHQGRDQGSSNSPCSDKRETGIHRLHFPRLPFSSSPGCLAPTMPSLRCPAVYPLWTCPRKFQLSLGSVRLTTQTDHHTIPGP